ncbi:M4 family metallopeptidase [Luedemannella flava]|uniref:Neutral metalloproteinase n=1 Tax=Luedemannella flava TaxID=349316 RepID=A0ABP4YKI8_9ACTN
MHRGPGDTIIRKGVTAGGNGSQYISYSRTYKGLPVIGGDAVVVTDANGVVTSTAAAQTATIAVGTTAKVSPAAAAATARGRLATVAGASTPTLSVLAWGTPALVWETVVEGAYADGRPSKLHVYVDATTGAVLDVLDEVREGSGTGYYYGSVSITTSGSGSSYSMTDTTRPGLRCGGQNGSAYTGTDDVWGNGSGTNLETACVDALYGAQKEWDMLSAWLGRNGVTGSGGAVPIRVGLNDVNAYWNGSYVNFGHNQANNRQATPIDVVGHEIGHAIFQYTPGGAGSSRENGGINEATGDIFGALTEAYANNPNDPPDYQVGEEVDLVGDGPIRYMYQPSLAGDPNCYSSAIPNTEVHAAAGPLNHWFYLLAEGSAPGGGKPNSPTCNSSSVTGIGIQKAGKIYYNAMLAKTSTWRYINVRVATLNAAKTLYPGSCTEFNTVLAAWNAVSVPAQSGEPTCSTSTNDFSIATSPTSGSVAAGSSVTATVSTATTAGSAQTVALTASGLPSGATASFSPSSVTSGGSSTLTIATSTSTPNGTYPITVTGTGAVVRTATYTLTVTGGTSGSCSGTNGTDISIPDAGSAVTSSIVISGCGRAPSTSSTVAVNIVHTYRGDLVIDLVAPDGSTYRLKSNSSSDSTDNVNTTYTVNVSGETANGTWGLRVQDVYSVDTGYINTWTLTL